MFGLVQTEEGLYRLPLYGSGISPLSFSNVHTNAKNPEFRCILGPLESVGILNYNSRVSMPERKRGSLG